MIVLFPHPGDRPSSTSPSRSSMLSTSIYSPSLGNKLQRLALNQPRRLRVLEVIVDRWLDDEDEAS